MTKEALKAWLDTLPDGAIIESYSEKYGDGAWTPYFKLSFKTILEAKEPEKNELA